ncbi:MAG: acyltransferase [Chloroflexota bacterium]
MSILKELKALRVMPAIVEKSADSFPATSSRIRIDYLDSLRGLAALSVVFLHCFEMLGMGLTQIMGIPTDARLTGSAIDRLLTTFYWTVVRQGSWAVDLFIVLSGYSLMLAVARSSDGKPSGGVIAYFKRRIRRIWPPYYAALIISILLILLIPALNTKSGGIWDLAIPITPASVVSHFLFIHYLNPDWFNGINPPLWTIGIEETIYVLFPLLFLPFWRRFGSLGMVLVGLVLSAAICIAFPVLIGARPWYLALFALGATGASIGFSSRERSWQYRLPWLKIGVVALVVFVAFIELSQRVDFHLGNLEWPLSSFVLDVGIVCLLIHYTEQWKQGSSFTFVLKVLHMPPLTWLGKFSYSLYLIHAPIVALVAVLCRRLGLYSLPAYGFMVLVGIPASIAGAYLFHQLIERHFMPTVHSQKQNDFPAESAQANAVVS